MTPITRTALYVLAVLAVLLWITILSVYESRQTSGPSATPLCCPNDVLFLPPPSSPLLGLSRDERGEVLRTEILAAGFTCDRVTLMERVPEGLQNESSSRVQGLYNQSSSRVQLWFIDCQDGHTYSIDVDPTYATDVDPAGSTTVRADTRLGRTK